MSFTPRKITRTEIDGDSGEETERDIPFMKGYTVFNVEQVEGLPAQYYAKAEPRLDTVPRIDRAESSLPPQVPPSSTAAIRLSTRWHRTGCRCRRSRVFRRGKSYYATLSHEMTHWTRHPKRLERDFGRKRWGDEGYAMEELVAELGSAFLSADLDLTPEVRADHASYIASWLKVLKDDKRAIFTAAAHAQRAADYLNGLQPAVQQEAAE